MHSSLQANGYKVIVTKLRSAPLDQCTLTAVRPGATGDWAGPPRPTAGASQNNSFERRSAVLVSGQTLSATIQEETNAAVETFAKQPRVLKAGLTTLTAVAGAR